MRQAPPAHCEPTTAVGPQPAAAFYRLVVAMLSAAPLLVAAAGPTAEPADTLKGLDALLAKAPADPQLRFRKAVLLVEQKRTVEAITLFRKLAEEFPALPEPQNNLAVLYADRGETDKARAALEAALRGRPSYDTVYRNLGAVNARMAGAAYARALNIDDSKNSVSRLALITALPDSEAATRAVAAPATVAAAAPVAPAVAVTPKPSAPTPPPAVVMPVMPVTPVTPPVAAPPAVTVAPAPPTVVAVVAPTPASPAASTAAPKKAVSSAAPASVAPAAASAATATTATTAAKPLPPAVPEPKPNDAAVEAAGVRKAVQDWAQAWSRKQPDAYIAAYVPGFKGAEASAAAWQAARRVRILNKKEISVVVSDMAVVVGKTQWSATFTQAYTADQLRLVSRKTLAFELRNGRWLIAREISAGGR